MDKPKLDRADDGPVRYAWKKDTAAVNGTEQEKLIRNGALKRHEGLMQLRDHETGKPVVAHGGSVYWNAYRRRWVMIAVEQGGTSFLGEVWYAEADAPLGPWAYAIKVVTHDRYSFYNPKQHPMFDQQGGQIIYFEGTYTHTFSGNPELTPRYDYNQIMYKLDLTSPRLELPVAVYSSGDDVPCRFRAESLEKELRTHDRVEFFALDRPSRDSVPIFLQRTAAGTQRLQVESVEGADDDPVFYGLPASHQERSPTTVPLYEYINAAQGEYAYSIDPNWSRPGFARAAAPLCRVWPRTIQEGDYSTRRHP